MLVLRDAEMGRWAGRHPRRSTSSAEGAQTMSDDDLDELKAAIYHAAQASADATNEVVRARVERALIGARDAALEEAARACDEIASDAMENEPYRSAWSSAAARIRALKGKP